jgi:hypothetical protein
MNCRVEVLSTKTEAVQRAIGIAAGLQAQLEGNRITCRAAIVIRSLDPAIRV